MPVSRFRFRRLAGLGAALAMFNLAGPALAQNPAPQLFRVVGARDEVTIGVTASEFAAMGGAPDVARLAQALVADGQLTAWQYVVGRGPEGTTRYVTSRRIAILRHDAMRIEPYAAALPVSPPPGP